MTRNHLCRRCGISVHAAGFCLDCRSVDPEYCGGERRPSLRRFPDCGTIAAAKRHYREHDPLCDDCREAQNRAERERRARRRVAA